MPSFTGVHHIALTVHDLDESVAFYARVFGFMPQGELDGENLARRIFSLPGGINLGLTEHDPTTTERFSPFRPGLDHLGLGVGDVAELEQWAAHLSLAGIEHSGLVEASYGTALSFADPDGTALEFFASS